MCTVLLCEELPWDNVAMVLHLRKNDSVPKAHVCPAPGLRDQVDCLGRPANKDDLGRTVRVYQASNLCSCLFIGSSRLLADLVDSTVNIRVVFVVKTGQLIDYVPRFLGRGRAVEIC